MLEYACVNFILQQPADGKCILYLNQIRQYRHKCVQANCTGLILKSSVDLKVFKK